MSVSLRPMTRDDLPDVARWLAAPHVQQWWVGEPSDLDSVRAKYGPRIDGSSATEMLVLTVEGRAIGMFQRYLIANYPDWIETLRGIVRADTAAGIDYLIGEPDALGHGYSVAGITAFVPMVFTRWPTVHSVVVDVQQANERSWRALERSGFTRLWAGQLDSDDPSDAGPSYVYQRRRRD